MKLQEASRLLSNVSLLKDIIVNFIFHKFVILQKLRTSLLVEAMSDML